MDKSLAMALTEVDEILKYMDEEHQKMIPKKLREHISYNKLEEYNVLINPRIPLGKKNISKRALSILAVINYKYWCTDEEHKERLLEKYKKNEITTQEKLRELYNPDEIFETSKQVYKNNDEEKQLIIYNKKENIIIKIINKIKLLFKLT